MDILRYDYDTISEDGSDNLTQKLLEILNSYPELELNTHIEFQVLDTNKGIAMFANPSVAVLDERESITGHISQTCAYDFTVVYRTRVNASGKERIKEWLDNLGRWIERIEYPALSCGKKFEKISRTMQASLYGTTEDKAEDWSISLQATYTNEFDK